MTDLVLDTETLRERLGNISQGAFADIAHVHQTTVSLWESDKNAPSRAAAALIEQHCAATKIKLAFKPAPPKSKSANTQQARAS